MRAAVVAAVAVLAPPKWGCSRAAGEVDAARRFDTGSCVASRANLGVQLAQGRRSDGLATRALHVSVARQLSARDRHVRVVDAVNQDRGGRAPASFGLGETAGHRRDGLQSVPVAGKRASARTCRPSYSRRSRRARDRCSSRLRFVTRGPRRKERCRALPPATPSRSFPRSAARAAIADKRAPLARSSRSARRRSRSEPEPLEPARSSRRRPRQPVAPLKARTAWRGG